MKFDHFSSSLFAALALSLLLHALALFGWGRPRPVPPALSAAAMRAVVVAAPSVPPMVVEPDKAAAAVAAVVHESRPARARQPPATPPVVAATGPAAEVATPIVPAAPAGGEPPAAAAMTTASAATVPAAANVSDGPSADGLRQYRIELAGTARRFRLYPAMARARGWEGVVEVTVTINAGLAVPVVQLVKSSGHALLDEQALAMLGRAVAGTPLPESLRGRSFVVAVPVRFSLEE